MGAENVCHSKSKDLMTLPLEQLRLSLITHEMMLGEYESKKRRASHLKVLRKWKKMRIWPWLLENSKGPSEKRWVKQSNRRWHDLFHIRTHCPLLNKDKFKVKKKVLPAAWDELDTSEAENWFWCIRICLFHRTSKWGNKWKF